MIVPHGFRSEPPDSSNTRGTLGWEIPSALPRLEDAELLEGPGVVGPRASGAPMPRKTKKAKHLVGDAALLPAEFPGPVARRAVTGSSRDRIVPLSALPDPPPSSFLTPASCLLARWTVPPLCGIR